MLRVADVGLGEYPPPATISAPGLVVSGPCRIVLLTVVVPLTTTVTVQVLLAGIVPPTRESELPLTAAVATPPGKQVVCGLGAVAELVSPVG